MAQKCSRAFGALALGGLILTTQSAWAAGSSNHVRDVRAEATGQATEIVVVASRTPKFRARLADKGKRLLVDILDADVKGAPGALTNQAGIVGGVMTQAFRVDGRKTTRISISLLKAADYSVTARGSSLVIAISPKAEPAKKASKAAKGKPVAHASAVRGLAKEVRAVRYSHNARFDRISIELVGKPSFSQSNRGSGRSRLRIRGAQLAKAAQRMLDVSAYGGLVSSISSYAARGGNGVIIDVAREKGAVGNVVMQGNRLIWTFRRPGDLTPRDTGVASDGGVARRTRVIAKEKAFGVDKIYTGDGVAEEQSAGQETAGFHGTPLAQTRTRFRGGRRRYSGRRVDIDLKDADIHNVLRILADVGRVNIVTADNVKGEVTLRLRNVPWDQALDVVLQAKSLGMVRKGNMVRVALLSDLEKEREMKIARLKQELELTPLETRLIPVSYAAAGELQARARELLSSRGSIAVDERTNVLIARDVSGTLNQVEELVRSLDTQTPQVLIEARIVEATSRYLRDVGIQWGGDATFSPATGNPTGLAFPSSVGLVGGGSDANTPTAGLSPFTNNVQNPNFAVNLPAAVGTGQGGALGLSFGSLDNNINLAVRLSAAESSGMLRIVSSPRILTLDNKEARIAQGTLIPFSQISAQGVQTNFQEAKLQLLVRPHVTADGSVAMHVKINRDEPDFNQTSARGDPTILKREAETDLLIMDGHTAVIGGIFTRNTGRNLDQIPFFGDIPLLGVLFQRRRASDSRGELVIFLTPRIVNRAAALGR